MTDDILLQVEQTIQNAIKYAQNYNLSQSTIDLIVKNAALKISVLYTQKELRQLKEINERNEALQSK